MSHLTEVTELVTAILVGVLFSILMSAFFILILILQRKRGGKLASIFQRSFNKGTIKDKASLPEITLLKAISSEMMNNTSDISMSEDGENLLVQEDPLWAAKASTIITHCMAVLVNCRALTEKLTGLAMTMLDEWDPQMGKLVDIAKMITLRVDQLVCCMRPPLNPQLLEARAASLTLAVTHLAIVTQYECKCDKLPADWVSKLLHNIQRHIEMINKNDSENYFQSNTESLQILHAPTIK